MIWRRDVKSDVGRRGGGREAGRRSRGGTYIITIADVFIQ